MDFRTVIRELYNQSDRGTWSESNEQFQHMLWKFTSNNQVDHLTAFLDSRVRSHLVIEAFSGDNLLIQAARCYRAELVFFLANRGVLLDHQNCDGDTALIVACENGDDITAEELLNFATTNINLINSRGENALMRACAQGHEDLALSLIRGGANTTCTNIDLDSTLTVACRQKLTQAAITIASRDKYPPLNNKGLDGATSLMVACNLGLGKVVTCLLDNNADATLRDTSGACCLEAAICGQQKDIIKFLITKGLDSYLTDSAFLHLIQMYTQIGMLKKPNSSAQTWEIDTSEIVRFFNNERNWRRRSSFIIFVHHYTKQNTNRLHEGFHRHEQSTLLNVINIRALLALLVSFI
jgi:ankyrin repeat protein